ncbi:MAG: hypothetical protein R3C02_25505 [Planctomycetaceae bacterium]
MITWFLLLFPVLNFFPITTLMNDRYMYLPCICAFGLASGAVVRLSREITDRIASSTSVRGRVNALFTGGIGVAAVFGYASATSSYLPVWRDGLSLWENAVERVPQLPVVQIQWADALHDSGQIERAIVVMEETLKSREPDEPDRQRIEERISRWHGEVGLRTQGEVNLPSDRENREIFLKGI